MNKEPLVSIIIPTYNRAKLLPRTINSVLKQNYKNWELIVIDDRSTDNTKELIEGYSKKDSRIKYVLNYHKKGPGGARNCGIENAKGKYIAFLDSDDEWFKQHLEESIAILESEPIEVCAAFWYEEKKGKLLENKSIPIKKAINELKPVVKKNACFFDKNLCEYLIFNGISFAHMDSLVIRKDILTKTGKMNENLFAAEDLEFMFRIFLNFNFGLIEYYHSIHHFGDDNIFAIQDEDIEKLDRTAYYHIKYLKLIKKHIKESDKISNKNKCSKQLNKHISDSYFGKGYLYRKTKRFKSLMNYLKAMYYNYDPIQIKAIKKLFKPGYYK